MDRKRLRLLARRHAADRPSRSCSHNGQAAACDAALLADEVSRHRAWADFASDLLDAHIAGFGSGDWQAAEALAHALEGSDWPPAWKRDRDDAAHIIVDPAVWPTSRTTGAAPPPTAFGSARIQDLGLDDANLRKRIRPLEEDHKVVTGAARRRHDDSVEMEGSGSSADRSAAGVVVASKRLFVDAERGQEGSIR
jgi:hypothetical protein